MRVCGGGGGVTAPPSLHIALYFLADFIRTPKTLQWTPSSSMNDHSFVGIILFLTISHFIQNSQKAVLFNRNPGHLLRRLCPTPP